MAAVDFNKTSDDYAKHRAGLPDSLFDRLAVFGVGQPGQRVLDLGTGTGTMARGLARRGSAVTGLDVAPSLLEKAASLAARESLELTFVQAPAERTGLPEKHFDVVTACQCWHWLDRPAVAREIRRVIRPGGRLVIAHFDWISKPGNVVEATEALIENYNPRQAKPHLIYSQGTGIYSPWLRDVDEAGFGDIETFSYDVAVFYDHVGWRGRVRASNGVGASLTEDEIARFDTDHAALLRERFAEERLSVPHRVFAVVCRAPNG